MIEADDIASVLVPITVTSAMVTSMTANGVPVPEDITPAWSSSTTYALGARAHSPVTHRVYESLLANNTAKDPTNPVNRAPITGVGTWWADVGPTNKFAMFDGLTSSETIVASPLVITLKPGAFNGLAMLGIDADGVDIVAKSATGGDVIYSVTDDMEGSEPGDYYEYFFEPFKPKTQIVATGIDPYGNAEITITLTKVTGSVKLGMLAIGDVRPLGAPERGVSVEPRGYSTITEDQYGNTVIRRRRGRATNLSLPIKLLQEDADNVINTVQELLDVPVVVIGSTDPLHSKLTTFGLISGRMDYAEFPYRVLNLTVKGMI